MKNTRRTKRETELFIQYDFSKAIRGIYAKRYAEGTNIVVLAPDVAAAFKTSQAVNEALRAIIKMGRQTSKKTTG